MKFDNSKHLLGRAKKTIPSFGQTFSKNPNQWPGNVSPHYLSHGEGAWVWDVDGNKFLDHMMALGPIILGYKNARVNAAITKQLTDGTIFSQMHPLEVEVSELLVELIPCAQKVRFGKTGSDATASAIRAARGYTGKSRIAVCGYHGWHDWYIATTTRDKGIPEAIKNLSHTFEYNNLKSLSDLLDRHSGEFAAIIMEPVGVIAPDPGFLEGVRDLANKHHVVLIFDEVVTGFRLSLAGAQDYFKVTPDLACFGKAMANGMPLSAVVGRAEIMDVYDDIFYSGTFGGETLSLAACKATIEELRTQNALEKIALYGGQLIQCLESLIEKHKLEKALKPLGQAPRSVLTFLHDDEREQRVRRTFFMQECIKRGLLYFGLHLPCMAHGQEELTFTRHVFEEVMPLFADAYHNNDFEQRLEGPCVEAIFRKP